jgi:hypothetical protein
MLLNFPSLSLLTLGTALQRTIEMRSGANQNVSILMDFMVIIDEHRETIVVALQEMSVFLSIIILLYRT